ncbi:hypothetical protein ACS0PU_008837 [Formica fusca]
MDKRGKGGLDEYDGLSRRRYRHRAADGFRVLRVACQYSIATSRTMAHMWHAHLCVERILVRRRCRHRAVRATMRRVVAFSRRRVFALDFYHVFTIRESYFVAD